MLHNVFNRASSAATAKSESTTTAENRTERIEVNTSSREKLASFNATDLFPMNETSGRIVEKLFLDMIQNTLLTSEHRPYSEFRTLMNENAYAAATGSKPYVLTTDAELCDFSWWQNYVSSDWTKPNSSDFVADIWHIDHQSDESGEDMLSFWIGGNHPMGGMTLSLNTRAGWSKQYLQRFVTLSKLLVMRKLGQNQSPKFEAYVTFDTNFMAIPFGGTHQFKKLEESSVGFLSPLAATQFLRYASTTGRNSFVVQNGDTYMSAQFDKNRATMAHFVS